MLALLDREVAGGEEREVGHHRLVGAPVPLRRVLADLAAAQLAVGDHLAAVGDPDLHVDHGLVERVVVGGEPPRRHVGLVHRDDLVLAGQPVALPGVGVPRRVVVVRHHDGVLAAGGERAIRGDPQLVPAVGLVEAGLVAVDGHLRDVEEEVEGEAGQVLGGGQLERRAAAQPLGVHRVAVGDLVGRHVDAAVAVERPVGIADAGRPVDGPVDGRCGGPRGRRGTTRPDGQAGGQRRREGCGQDGAADRSRGHRPNLAPLIALRCRSGPATMGATRRECARPPRADRTPVPVRREEP